MKSVDEELSRLALELERVLADLKPVVDRSVHLRAQPARRDAVNTMWENFLAAFLDYARKASREMGQDFFQGVSLARIFGR